MNKRGQINYKILFFSIIGIILIAGIVFEVLYLNENNDSICEKGGKYNEKTKICEYLAIKNFSKTCEAGFVFNENLLVCEKQVKFIVDCIGVFNKSTGICTIFPNETYICLQGNLTLIEDEWKCIVNINPVNLSNETNLSNIPYSFFAIHFEIDHHDETLAAYRWENLVATVEFANQYHVPLTIMFWPGSVKYALASSDRIGQVREWQAQGHEIALHNQECSGDDFSEYSQSDNILYQQLAGDYAIKSGTTACTAPYLLSSFIYQGVGRSEGRSSVAIKTEIIPGHVVYNLNMKAGYANGTSIKIAQYNTLNGNEIYGFVNHGEGDAGGLGGTKELLEWMRFLSNQDFLGSKRMTLSNLMENYVLPNNLVVDANQICNSQDSQVERCLPLAKIPSKSDSSACQIGLVDFGVFNLGRCINTGTYCAIENGLTNEQLCQISKGDFYSYQSTSCTLLDILQSPYNSQDYSSYCLNSGSASCGDGICDGLAGEKTNCSQDCSFIE